MERGRAPLVKAGIPAVVANQFEIHDKSAIAFSQQFYRALVGGLPIERAVTAGRIAAYNANKEGRDWGVPVLYLRAGDGQLFAGADDPAERAGRGPVRRHPSTYTSRRSRRRRGAGRKDPRSTGCSSRHRGQCRQGGRQSRGRSR